MRRHGGKRVTHVCCGATAWEMGSCGGEQVASEPSGTTVCESRVGAPGSDAL